MIQTTKRYSSYLKLSNPLKVSRYIDDKFERGMTWGFERFAGIQLSPLSSWTHKIVLYQYAKFIKDNALLLIN